MRGGGVGLTLIPWVLVAELLPMTFRPLKPLKRNVSQQLDVPKLIEIQRGNAIMLQGI